MNMKKKISVGEAAFRTVNLSVLILISLVCIYPMWHIIMASFSVPGKLMSHSGLLLVPEGFIINAYQSAFRYEGLVRSYMNTIFIVVVGTVINLSLTIITSYFLSCKNVLYKNYVLVFIMITMYFSGGMIPLYLTVKDFKMLDSVWALIFPTAISVTNVIMMRTNFQTIPDALTESAYIDGANHFTILFKIIIPVSKAIIAVITLYYAVGHWNSWFPAMMYIKTKEKYPLQLVLREILIQAQLSMSDIGVAEAEAQKNNTADTIKYAITVISTLPILMIYPFLQKYFVKGIMIGSIKG